MTESMTDTNPCKALFEKRLNGKMTNEELLTELAYYSVSDEAGFKELIPTPFPERPYQLIQQDTLPDSKKDKDIWEDPKVYKYTNECQRIRAENRSKLKWLKEIKSYLPDKDLIRHQLIDEKISLFEE